MAGLQRPAVFQEAQMFDRNHLREVTDGDAEFERELLDAYQSSAKQILSELRANLTTRDSAGIVRGAHALKGASLSVGAVSLAKCASEMETAARCGDVSKASAWLDDLLVEEQALWVELDHILH